jgi:hypothetical protein
LEANKHLHNGWAIPGIGGTDMVIGEAGTAVTLDGGGVHGIAIPMDGGTDIIGGAGFTAGVHTPVRTEDSSHLFIFYEPNILEFFSSVPVPRSRYSVKHHAI